MLRPLFSGQLCHRCMMAHLDHIFLSLNSTGRLQGHPWRAAERSNLSLMPTHQSESYLATEEQTFSEWSLRPMGTSPGVCEYFQRCLLLVFDFRGGQVQELAWTECSFHDLFMVSASGNHKLQSPCHYVSGPKHVGWHTVHVHMPSTCSPPPRRLSKGAPDGGHYIHSQSRVNDPAHNCTGYALAMQLQLGTSKALPEWSYMIDHNFPFLWPEVPSLRKTCKGCAVTGSSLEFCFLISNLFYPCFYFSPFMSFQVICFSTGL